MPYEGNAGSSGGSLRLGGGVRTGMYSNEEWAGLPGRVARIDRGAARGLEPLESDILVSSPVLESASRFVFNASSTLTPERTLPLMFALTPLRH